jgi:hypothetical protein
MKKRTCTSEWVSEWLRKAAAILLLCASEYRGASARVNQETRAGRPLLAPHPLPGCVDLCTFTHSSNTRAWALVFHVRTHNRQTRLGTLRQCPASAAMTTL